jgi:hypothetical protein
MRLLKTFLPLTLWALLAYASTMRQDGDDTSQWTYVPSPRMRGTWKILSASCAALIACTWSTLHLNVPNQRQDNGQSWKAKLKYFVHDTIPPLKWTAAAILTPEALVGFAFNDWMHARRTESLLRTFGKEELRSWDRTKIQYANMGGFNFKLHLAAGWSNHDQETSKIQDAFLRRGNTLLLEMFRKSYTSAVSVFQIVINKFICLYCHCKDLFRGPSNHLLTSGTSSAVQLNSISRRDSTALANSASQGINIAHDNVADQSPLPTSDISRSKDALPIPSASANQDTSDHDSQVNEIFSEKVNVYLNATQILVAQHLGILNGPDNFTTEDIEDKSKNTLFTKILLLLPLLTLAYFVVDRSSENLPVSQLEIAVCTYGVCTVITSFFYWSKPQSVGVPIQFRYSQLRPIMKNDVNFLVQFGGTSFIRTNFFPPFGANKGLYYRKITERISNDNIVGRFCEVMQATLHDADFASVLVGTIFGILYCFAWNSAYPTPVERVLWRISSLVVTTGLIPYAVANAYFTGKYAKEKTNTDIRQIIGLYSLLSLYILARLFLIWEMFWSLFYQPREVFQNV